MTGTEFALGLRAEATRVERFLSDPRGHNRFAPMARSTLQSPRIAFSMAIVNLCQFPRQVRVYRR